MSQESDVLQSEVRLLEAERQRMLRELVLKAELEEGYAWRGAAQGAALKQAQVGGWVGGWVGGKLVGLAFCWRCI